MAEISRLIFSARDERFLDEKMRTRSTTAHTRTV